jgi:hypothetical protein
MLTISRTIKKSHNLVFDDHDVKDVVAVAVGDVWIDSFGEDEPERFNLAQTSGEAVRVFAQVNISENYFLL